jgi:hypothetical protein
MCLDGILDRNYGQGHLKNCLGAQCTLNSDPPVPAIFIICKYNIYNATENSFATYYDSYKKKGKAIPLHSWSGPEGSRKLRFPDCMTMAQDGGKVVSLTHRPPLPPGNAPGTHFC